MRLPRRTTALLLGIALLVAAGVLAWRSGLLDHDDDVAADPQSVGSGPALKEGNAHDGDVMPAALSTKPRAAALPTSASDATRTARPDESAGIAYRALVVDPEGKPLRGAVLRVVARERAPVAILGDEAPPSGADGRVALLTSPQNAPRYLWTRATLDGRVQQQGEAALVREKETRIVLGVACPLRLRVIDAESGTPVAGATARAVSGQMVRAVFSHGFDAPACDEATTDADGRATLATEGGPAIVYVVPMEHAATAVRGVTVPREGVDIEVKVGRGGTLVGRVSDARGAAVAGATVQLDVPMAYRKSTTTDGEGRYRLSGVPTFDAAARENAGSDAVAMLSAVASGFPWTTRQAESLPAAGETETLDVTLELGARIEGRILGARDVAALRLRVECWDGRTADVRLETDGHFVAGPLCAGLWMLTVEERQSGRVLANVRQVVHAGADVAGVEIRLSDRSGALALRVVDADGKPVANVEIEARAMTGSVNGVVGVATTAADGRARIDGLPRDLVTISMRPPGSAPLGRTLTADELSSSKEIVVALAGGESSGKALRLDGSPARVRLHLSALVGMLHDNGQSVESAADGSFRFRYLAAGKSAAIHADGEEHVVLPDNLGLDSYAAPGIHDLRLLIATRDEVGHLHIAATLRDAKSGESVPAVAMECAASVSPPGDEERYHYLWHGPETDELGHFLAMEAMQPGIYDVRFVVPGYRSVRLPGFRLPWSGVPPTLKLERGARLRGVVQYEDGTPVVGARVSVGGDQESKTDADGRYALSGLDPGAGEVVLRGTYVQTATATTSLRDDSESVVDFAAARAGAVRVRFLRLDPSTPGGINVVVQPLAGAEPRTNSKSVEAAAQYGVEVTGIPPGRVRVVVSRLSHAAAPIEVDVKPGETADVVMAAP